MAHGPEPEPYVHGPEPQSPPVIKPKPVAKPVAKPAPTSGINLNQKTEELDTLLKDLDTDQIDYNALLRDIDNKTGLNPMELGQLLNQVSISEFDSPEIVNRLQQALKQASVNKRLYNNLLPTHSFIVKLNHNDYNCAVECGNILVNALDQELLSNSYLFTNRNKVEVECNIQGPKYLCARAIYEISKSVASSFSKVIKKIGSNDININLAVNKKSSYKEVSLQQIEDNHQLFLQKIAQGNYDY
jgi:hypothetical protein